MAFDSRFHTTCCRRTGSPEIGPMPGSMTFSSRISFASAAVFTVSTASSMNVDGLTGWMSSRSLPEVMRLMSSRSSISCVWARALRSMASRPFARSLASFELERRIFDHPRMALRGVRSSCESVARNSSLMSLARSAVLRAARSLSSSAFRSSAARCMPSYIRALSMAMPAWAATPTASRSERSVNTFTSGCPNSSAPCTAPVRAGTATAR